MSALFLFTCILAKANCTPEFDKYVQVFEQHYGQSIPRGVQFSWGELEEPLNAICTDDHKQIIVNKKRWGTLTEDQHEAVILHELGHCVLGLTHTDQGLMRSQLLSTKEYVSNREALIKDLFTNPL